MGLHQAFLSCNGGEVTPYLAYLTSFDKHASSVEKMENYLPMPFGGCRKRPGTLWQALLAGPTRLEPFHLTGAGSYILAFTTTTITIFRRNGTVADTVALAVANPFTLQCCQINDVMFIVAADIAPRRLSRIADADWLIEVLPFPEPPLLDENLDEAFTLEASFIPTNADLAADVGQAVALIASKPLFTAGHVGAVFQISKERAVGDYEVDLAATLANDGVSSVVLIIQGRWTFITFGTWFGTFVLERSRDRGVTWEDIRSYQSDGDRNVTSEGEEPTRVLMRIRWDHVADGTDPRGVLASVDSHIRGYVRVTAVTDSTHAASVAVTPVQKCTTDAWTEGAFSTHQGFPVAIDVHDSRLIFAGTRRTPLGLWMSKSDNLTNFLQSTEADGSIFRVLSATRQDPISWIRSQRRLFVGTTGGEWVIGSETNDAPLAPDNFFAREYTRFGSNSVPALAINDSIFFVERQGLRLRELAYILERETFDAANLTRLAEHVTKSGIVQMAWQHNREPYLWSVTNDGALLAFAYIRDERIAAWAPQTTQDGAFRSVAVLRNESDDDDVFTVVQRAGAYHLERLARSQQAYQEAEDLAEIHHVDSGVHVATTGPNHEVAVPPHLDGQKLNVLADGIFSQATPAGGKFRLPDAAADVHAGLPVTSTFKILPQDLTLPDGTTHARKKRANEIILSVYKSFGDFIVNDCATK